MALPWFETPRCARLLTMRTEQTLEKREERSASARKLTCREAEAWAHGCKAPLDTCKALCSQRERKLANHIRLVGR